MPRTLPAALVLLLTAFAPACVSTAAPPRTVPEASSLTEALRRAYLRALSEAAEGDASGARKALAPLLRVRPPHVPSHLLHQDLVRASGEGESLGEEYRGLAREVGGSADAEVLLARATGATAEERIAAYQAAAVRDPKSPWPRVALAAARAETARSLQRRSAERAREGFAEEAKKHRADARSAVDRARTEGERAVALAPGLAAAHAALGHALGLAADLAAEDDRERRAIRARALDSFGKALELDPGDPRVLRGRAMVLRDAERREDAQKDLDAAAAAAPRDPDVLAARARNLEDLGLFRESADAWRRAAAAAPEDADLRTDLGTALARAGHWREALEEYRRADALFAARGGERWKARCGLVTALAQLGLDAQDPRRLSEAAEQLRAYRAEGGPDSGWAGRMAELLGVE